MRFPLLGKGLALGAVALALMAALAMVSDIVSERQGRLREAEQSVMDSLATRQIVVGPVLQQHCQESWEEVQTLDNKSQIVPMQRQFDATVTPVTLDINATTQQVPRYRGIYKVNGYSAASQINAEFSAPSTPPPTKIKGTVRCDAATVWVAVSDARGLAKAELVVNERSLPVSPGTAHRAHPRGFQAKLPDGWGTSSATAPQEPLRVKVKLDLMGTAQIGFAPLAANNRVALASDWPHPSFTGRALPNQRDISSSGFNAVWQISALATAAGQQMQAGGVACELNGAQGFDAISMATNGNATNRPDCIETFGVGFIEPVNNYVLSDRATKYGLLFIALTFVGVVLIEVQRRLRVHPIQYLLVGAALVMFFLLLVSLSEHLAFAQAYVMASTACTVLLALYGRFVLGGLRPGLVFGGAIAALYGALFLLLQLEQSALVLGSILLFVVLACVMMSTRHIDWYAFTANLRREEQAAR
jgi:inner membrane protein